MKRKVLLIEPDYKNKYPPLGLMKLAMYFRQCGDYVRFYKGDLKEFAARLLCEEFFSVIKGEPYYYVLGKYFYKLENYIKTGKLDNLEVIPGFRYSGYEDIIRRYRRCFQDFNFIKFDIVAVTSLFTFYWQKTIDTINYAKNFCKKSGRILVGGIAATILPEYIFKETGVKALTGLLDKPGVIDADNNIIIDELPPDYSILDEIDYKYPSSDAYLAYMTRGCIRQCSFCAVPRLEPIYKSYISIKQNIDYIDKNFGAKKDLLLMDNNVLASPEFDKIIEEIKSCGFAKGAYYVKPNEYEIAFNNLKNNFNERACVKKIINLYDNLAERLAKSDAKESGKFYIFREENNLLYAETASTEDILDADSYFRNLYNKYFKASKRMRFIDFNQGIDARLINDDNMQKLAELNIKPLRIAFDHYEQRGIYINAVKLAAKHGIKDLSNYLLYNFNDRPEDLYKRLEINVDLCEELDVAIYSFPMKYHPIDDPEYFKNRDYIGANWNRKFIRAVQAVLNATQGKIGRGKNYFHEAFGRDLNEFFNILWMPENFIINRFKYKENLTREWHEKFCSLNGDEKAEAQKIIAQNDFNFINKNKNSKVSEILEFYRLPKDR
nr:hypothetical protein [Synergistaceae bacterium]